LAKGSNNSTIIPSYLSGIKIRVAGRLLTQRVIPRLTVKTIQRGTLARGKANFIDSSRFTNKNRRGSFSITVTIGHIFY
jgi:ribosomal protein S3